MAPPNGPFFFLHVMKTGGTTFISQVQHNFPRDQVYPSPDLAGMPKLVAYMFPESIATLTPEERDRYRFYCGHLPFFATAMVGRPLTTLTILRDPITRTISHLRHIKRGAQVDGVSPNQRFCTMSLEQIYEDPDRFTRFLHNYQSKLFAMGPDDGMKQPCAVNLHNIQTVPKSAIGRRAVSSLRLSQLTVPVIAFGTVFAICVADRPPGTA